MLTIKIPSQEAFDESTGMFVTTKEYTLKLEHSLLSLQKWESKHHKYFLDNESLTYEEVIDYIRCMTLNQVDNDAYECLTQENLEQIKDYLKDPYTATWFSSDDNKPKSLYKKDIITAECIYSSMIMLQIPVDIFEKRHLNHLLTLIRVCNEKQNPEQPKKTNPMDTLRRYREINKARKAKYGIKG